MQRDRHVSRVADRRRRRSRCGHRRDRSRSAATRGVADARTSAAARARTSADVRGQWWALRCGRCPDVRGTSTAIRPATDRWPRFVRFTCAGGQPSADFIRFGIDWPGPDHPFVIKAGARPSVRSLSAACWRPARSRTAPAQTRSASLATARTPRSVRCRRELLGGLAQERRDERLHRVPSRHRHRRYSRDRCMIASGAVRPTSAVPSHRSGRIG
jgi:hypothetical protein